ncbi:MAG TPA: VOC family protein, partial [Gemmatimonadaceae bacterium]|nr:VOC family protein [Gemmatimonadaceae bacterium]
MSDTSMTDSSAIQISSAVPTFLVSDIASTARWYEENLGFETAGHVPDSAPYVYASLMRDSAEVMLLNLAGLEKPDSRHLRPRGLWDAYLRMRGVHALYETVKGQSFIQMPLTHQSYGDWEFEV